MPSCSNFEARRDDRSVPGANSSPCVPIRFPLPIWNQSSNSGTKSGEFHGMRVTMFFWAAPNTVVALRLWGPAAKQVLFICSCMRSVDGVDELLGPFCTKLHYAIE